MYSEVNEAVSPGAPRIRIKSPGKTNCQTDQPLHEGLVRVPGKAGPEARTQRKSESQVGGGDQTPAEGHPTSTTDLSPTRAMVVLEEEGFKLKTEAKVAIRRATIDYNQTAKDIDRREAAEADGHELREVDGQEKGLEDIGQTMEIADSEEAGNTGNERNGVTTNQATGITGSQNIGQTVGDKTEKTSSQKIGEASSQKNKQTASHEEAFEEKDVVSQKEEEAARQIKEEDVSRNKDEIATQKNDIFTSKKNREMINKKNEETIIENNKEANAQNTDKAISDKTDYVKKAEHTANQDGEEAGSRGDGSQNQGSVVCPVEEQFLDDDCTEAEDRSAAGQSIVEAQKSEEAVAKVATSPVRVGEITPEVQVEEEKTGKTDKGAHSQRVLDNQDTHTVVNSQFRAEVNKFK